MKALLALRGSMREVDREHLLSLGYDVTWVEDIESIRQIESTSLRDFFAAAALQNPAICTGEADHWQIVTWFGQDRTGIYRREIVAKQAMDYANALLAERAKSLTSKE